LSDEIEKLCASTFSPAGIAPPGIAVAGVGAPRQGQHCALTVLPAASLSRKPACRARRGGRAAHAEGAPPKIKYRKPADRRSRPQRWRDAVTELAEMQAGYQVWLDALPENLADGAMAEALRAICDYDFSELENLEPPRGFGRD
jgi:hypothetical protein